MPTHLKAGDRAPTFSGIDQDGNKISLADFKGKKVVLYFYPADDTPVCTVQSCNLRDNNALLLQHGFQVIGVSPDDSASHKKFEQKFGLPFPLIADPKKTIIEKYGVWGEKNMYGNIVTGLLRTTFVIDGDGMIARVFARPRNKQHAEEILKAMS